MAHGNPILPFRLRVSPSDNSSESSPVQNVSSSAGALSVEKISVNHLSLTVGTNVQQENEMEARVDRVRKRGKRVCVVSACQLCDTIIDVHADT
jgi:predicted molibdopterin-dependent oxidoreductase YjgC